MNDTMHYVAEAATIEHSARIAELLLHYSKMGNLLPRNQQDIEQSINNFFIIRDQEQVIACGALEHFSDELAEIRSLVVDPSHHGKGLGRVLVERLIQLARSRHVDRLMALTYSAGFFEKLGFQIVDKSIFPEKIWGVCVNCYKFNNCDETAVLLNLST